MLPGLEIAGVWSEVDRRNPRSLDHDEYVVLVHTGGEPLDLTGCSLTNWKADRRHHYRYLFPRFLSNGESWLLEPGGMILLYTGRGTNGATGTEGEARQYHLYQHRSVPVWADPGDRVCLWDRSGRLCAVYELPVVPESI